MQNDMLKNTIAPWQEKGRWYHLRLISDGSTWTIDKDHTDDFLSSSSIQSSYYLDLGIKGCVVDFKMIEEPGTTVSSLLLKYVNAFMIRMTSTGYSVQLSYATSVTGTCDLYFYIV